MRYRIPVLFIPIIAAAGCASSGAMEGSDAMAKQQTILTGESGSLLAERPRAVGGEVPQEPGTVWLAVKKAYADLEIPITTENPGGRQIGNNNFYRTRQLAKEPMTQFVDCGAGMTGPKAASYRIYISVLTDVIPNGKGGTKVQTTFIPVGQDMSGSSSDRLPCGSTGRLEGKILDYTKAALVK
jgi:hypothetical protein